MGTGSERLIPSFLIIPLFELSLRLDKISGVLAAILYGSAIRGELTKKSDLDVFVLFSSDAEKTSHKNLITHAVLEVGRASELEYEFSVVLYSVEELNGIDTEYLRTLTDEGLVFYARASAVLRPPQTLLSPAYIIGLDMSGTDQRTRSAVHRFVSGYTSKKIVNGREKEYNEPGRLSLLGSFLSKRTFLIPQNNIEQVVQFLANYGIRFKKVPVWVENWYIEDL